MRVLGRSFLRVLRLAIIVGIGVATLVGSTIALSPAARELRTAATSTGSEIDLPALGGTSIMYDRFGKPLQSFQAEKREVVTLDQIPATVIESVLAVEDSGFYRHGAVDAKSILRALRTNVDSGGAQQGGSTITQQVVKNTITGSKRTLNRKLTEAKLATQLEKQLTKDQILERYLNTIYLGNNSYGVEAAAQTYWGVDVSKLDWARGALLAGMIRNPVGYDPVRHPAAARKQRALALRRLVATGRLSQADADKSAKEPLPHKAIQLPNRPDDYFVQEVEDRLLNKTNRNDTVEAHALGKDYKKRYDAFFRGGLRIYTTYDPAAQQKAVDARQASNIPGGMGADGTFYLPDYVDPATGKAYPQFGTMSIVSVEPSTGAVRVLLGGQGLSKTNRFDIATDGVGKQPGSSFKTFVLAAAMEAGYVPDDQVDGSSPCGIQADDPRYVDPARPAPQELAPFFTLTNFAGEGGSFGTLTSQTLVSSNCAFARLGQIVGLRKVIDMAHAMGITTCINSGPPPDNPACMSPWHVPQAYGGTNGVYPLDMADAYATLANDGVHNAAYFVDRIEDRDGHVIWSHPASPKRAMSIQSARLVTQILEQNVQGGTGTAAQLPSGQPSAGKTGTTTEAKNIWFVGYTPQLATAVWIGDASTTAEVPLFGGSATGGVYAAYSWGVFMASLLDGQPVVPFPKADPTRKGTPLNIGPGDGSPLQLSDALAAKLRDTSDCGAATGTDPTSGPVYGSACGGPPSTDPATGATGATLPGGGTPPSSTAPPITSYPPR